MIKYYKITALGGHVGARKSVDLVFYIKANDMFSAMAKCKKMPAVKHNHSCVVQSAVEITEEEYTQSRDGYSAYDVYKEGDRK